ncbi:hypothetical protein [Amycolatopsis panacis]|uniref:Uncharacterized protein n=1 Tax=Amycolatopsis panacis TaxID=2340917 RepID=A0A419I6R3_9PSEU|nr:hypothetical protein [Amycolatopsis panacis]RJQ87228.1 hypothetical protein D5S19_09820 [Amycolatopsis panacis]
MDTFEVIVTSTSWTLSSVRPVAVAASDVRQAGRGRRFQFGRLSLDHQNSSGCESMRTPCVMRLRGQAGIAL